ncbi:hypothetical protein [Marinobacter sp. ELB17]|uniref:hypothetical protein n=1 Tax=Marinobacter sp. ELB17 TaxID=270374 RepID=UPI0000F3A858|nr:hypothetical protein [Marinobacter sp. ELB17]EAZ98256.1 hypothetical protein MELB17_08461 [Marinobacter sp. ELB17]
MIAGLDKFREHFANYQDQYLLIGGAAAWHIGPRARVVPLRQEQLKERLGERFRELDVPLMVEWPGGEHAGARPREAIEVY